MTVRFTKDMAYDSSSKMIYLASDVANTYAFICKFRPLDGVPTYCAKFDGDAAEYPFTLNIFGNYLLLHGSSTSSEFKSNPSHTYGNFVLWLHKDLQGSVCSVLTFSEETSLSGL